MKCLHCNGEHPDEFNFCPITGKEIVNELKTCSNESCPDFGKQILPQEAKFCPRCGERIVEFACKDIVEPINLTMEYTIEELIEKYEDKRIV